MDLCKNRNGEIEEINTQRRYGYTRFRLSLLDLHPQAASIDHLNDFFLA